MQYGTTLTNTGMSAIDDLLANNAAYAEGFTEGSLKGPPSKRLAIVACMDARMEMGRVLGLEEGDAHVIRNAGGVITEDAIRSLVISQRLLELALMPIRLAQTAQIEVDQSVLGAAVLGQLAFEIVAGLAQMQGGPDQAPLGLAFAYSGPD